MINKPLLFMHAPPEHIPHVINASVLFSGLRKVYGIDPIWVTMNSSKQDDILPTKAFIENLKIEELLEYSDVEVENCCKYIDDEMNPKIDELEEFILKFNPPVVFVYYFPPFWYPIVQICKKHNISVGIHVQVNYIVNGENFIFDNIENAREALIEADFLTVSQQREKFDLSKWLNIEEENIYVIDKSIPSKMLSDIVNGNNDEKFYKEYSEIFSIMNSSKKNMGYIGRFDDIKNIHWFLEECMIKLNDCFDKFNLILIGDGNRRKEIELLAKNYENVYVLKAKIPYKDTLTFIKNLDLVIFPSGYDLTPRLPLEALAVGTNVILGDFNFNDVYKEYSIVIPEERTEECRLDYTNYKAVYGVPNSEIMAEKIKTFVCSNNIESVDIKKISEKVNPLININSFYEALKKYLR